MTEPTPDRDAPLAERNERAVGFAGGLLAVVGVLATVQTWLGPWDAESLYMRCSMPGFTALFMNVAVTGQHSRETQKALRLALLLMALGWGLSQAVPLLHLPLAYTALTLCAALLAAVGIVKLNGASSVAAAAAAIIAALALAWYRGRLGTYAPPLPDFSPAFMRRWFRYTPRPEPPSTTGIGAHPGRRSRARPRCPHRICIAFHTPPFAYA